MMIQSNHLAVWGQLDVGQTALPHDVAHLAVDPLFILLAGNRHHISSRSSLTGACTFVII